MLLLISLFTIINTTDTFKWKANPQGQELANMINKLRLRNNLNTLEVVDSLNYIGSSHMSDILARERDKGCSFSSWSYGSREWSGGCVEEGDTSSSVMHCKPKELIRYPYRGYEIIHVHKEEYCDYECAYFYFLLHRSTMLLDPRWKRMGVCIYKRVASVWFTEI